RVLFRSFSDRNALRTSHTAPEAYEERHVHRVAHGDVADRNILEQAAIDRFQSDPAEQHDHAIRICTVADAAIRFRPKLDSAIARSLRWTDAFAGRIK